MVSKTALFHEVNACVLELSLQHCPSCSHLEQGWMKPTGFGLTLDLGRHGIEMLSGKTRIPPFFYIPFLP